MLFMVLIQTSALFVLPVETEQSMTHNALMTIQIRLWDWDWHRK